MDTPKITFGDKIFLYGQFMSHDFISEHGSEFASPQYNAVMGYIPIGGYGIIPQQSDIVGVCLPGFVVDYFQILGQSDSLALQMSFSHDELIDVTDRMALQPAMLDGQKIWMPLSSMVAE